MKSSPGITSNFLLLAALALVFLLSCGTSIGIGNPEGEDAIGMDASTAPDSTKNEYDSGTDTSTENTDIVKDTVATQPPYYGDISFGGSSSSNSDSSDAVNSPEEKHGDMYTVGCESDTLIQGSFYRVYSFDSTHAWVNTYQSGSEGCTGVDEQISFSMPLLDYVERDHGIAFCGELAADVYCYYLRYKNTSAPEFFQDGSELVNEYELGPTLPGDGKLDSLDQLP